MSNVLLHVISTTSSNSVEVLKFNVDLTDLSVVDICRKVVALWLPQYGAETISQVVEMTTIVVSEDGRCIRMICDEEDNIITIID